MVIIQIAINHIKNIIEWLTMEKDHPE